ncbi:MAG TPA: hypothetical protein PLA90_08525 [Candidatus Sumerlaeota bacterium]|nr:hypothetical protein [Candidatus Sumerlaeota bacterium]HPS01573.1 hypothetical protein [Candidatus Sumerlaeota bacterium]
MSRSSGMFFACIMALCMSVFALTGCSGNRVKSNHLHDFYDMFQVGFGVTNESPKSGTFPIALGVYAQATDYLNAGAVKFNGHMWERDGRGVFSGHEEHTRLGLGPLQVLQFKQDYVNAKKDYFKTPGTKWDARMESQELRWKDGWKNTPAKELIYEYWADELHVGLPVMYRGYQYWGLCSIEIGISDPLLTHFGFDLKLGFDPSEVSDWVLGYFDIDYKRDDLTDEEYKEMPLPYSVPGGDPNAAFIPAEN